MAPPTKIERDLQRLASELRQLEAEYNMFFAGRSPKPPWETRNRVEALVKQYDRTHIQNYGDRFRFTTLQSRFASFVDLWDKGLRSRDEGRPGPLAHKSAGRPEKTRGPEDKIVHVAAFRDPLTEMEKLHDLYDSLVEARREIGEEAVPFHKFTELVRTQVTKLKHDDSEAEVAFRVAVKDGKVSLTARALKGGKE